MENENVAQSNIDATTETAETVNAPESAETATAETTNSVDKTTDQTKVVPETYAEFTLPEGVKMDSGMLEKFLPLAKEINLPQEKAQQLIDLYVEGMIKSAEYQIQHRTLAFTELMDEIKAATPANQKHDENIGRINAVFNKYGENLSDIIHKAGAELAAKDKQTAKAFYAGIDKLARAASVDTHLVKGGTVTDPRPLANQIFDESLKDL